MDIAAVAYTSVLRPLKAGPPAATFEMCVYDSKLFAFIKENIQALLDEVIFGKQAAASEVG